MKYCSKCGAELSDNANVCVTCGADQDMPMSHRQKQPPVIWPLVLSILFLVASLVTFVCSLTIILSMFLKTLSIIICIFSILSIIGAKVYEKKQGINGVFTAAKVTGAIALILAIISLSIGLITTGWVATKITDAYTSKWKQPSSYTNKTPTYTIPSSTNTQAAKTPNIMQSIAKVKELKYGFIITENEVYGIRANYNGGQTILGPAKISNATASGVGVLTVREDEYLHIYIVKDYNSLATNEIITFAPDGELLYVFADSILYIKNGEFRVQQFENTGSVIADKKVEFIIEQSAKQPEHLDFFGASKFYDKEYGEPTVSMYAPSVSYQQILFKDTDDTMYYVSHYDSKEETFKFFLKTAPNSISHIINTGDLFDLTSDRLVGHAREGDNFHLYLSTSKDDIKINLPEGYSVSNIRGIKFKNDGSYSLTEAEWVVADTKTMVIAMKDNTLWYNTNTTSVKGVDMASYDSLNKEINRTKPVTIHNINQILYIEAENGTYYVVNNLFD